MGKSKTASKKTGGSGVGTGGYLWGRVRPWGEECILPQAPKIPYCNAFAVSVGCGMLGAMKDICRYIEKGVKPELAAELCGIPRRVFLRRMKAGELDVENGARDTQDAMLWLAVQDAKKDYVLFCQNALNSQIQDNDFKATKLALENFMPSDFKEGDKDEKELEPIQIIEGQAMEIEHQALPEPELVSSSDGYLVPNKIA